MHLRIKLNIAFRVFKYLTSQEPLLNLDGPSNNPPDDVWMGAPLEVAEE